MSGRGMRLKFCTEVIPREHRHINAPCAEEALCEHADVKEVVGTLLGRGLL